MLAENRLDSAARLTTPLAACAATRTALHTLLDAHLGLSPEYRGQLTSHLPMALHALSSLGADSARLHAFFWSYARRLPEGRVVAAGAPAADWAHLRGTADGFPALLATMNALVARDGVDETLRRVVPDLLPGVAAAAFHGVIRTAHAVESGHPGEIAAALAYWAWRFQPLTPPAASSRAVPFEAWAEELVRAAPAAAAEGSLIAFRMERVTRGVIYERLAGALVDASSLPEALARFAQLAARCYIATENFTVLHLVTGLRALRVLSAWLPPDEATAGALQRVLSHAFTAAFLSAGAVLSAEPPVARLQTWPEVIAAAIGSDDDHTIKLVHTCREEAAVYGEGLYLQAAGLAVG
jgi:hypothetical protein